MMCYYLNVHFQGKRVKSRVSEFYERAPKRRNVTGPLTRKTTGLPGVLDARQPQHRLNAGQSDSEHTSDTRLPQESQRHNTDCALRHVASAVFSSRWHSPPTFFWVMQMPWNTQLEIVRHSAATLPVSTALSCRSFEATFTSAGMVSLTLCCKPARYTVREPCCFTDTDRRYPRPSQSVRLYGALRTAGCVANLALFSALAVQNYAQFIQ
jgi:hypothetical protein